MEYVGNAIPAPGYAQGGSTIDDELLFSTQGGFTQKGVTLKPGQGVLLLGTLLKQDPSSKQYIKATDNTATGVLRQTTDTGLDADGQVWQANIVLTGLLRSVQLRGRDEREALPTFEDCVRAGNPVVDEVPPRKCVLPDARTVVENAAIVPASPSAARSLPPRPPNTIFVFFGNYVRDPKMQKCMETYPVVRSLPKGAEPVRFALEELLKGPTDADVQEGYVTYIPEGLALRDLSVRNGVASVLFGTSAPGGPGGFCRSIAYRSQLTNTLKQFPVVRDILFRVGDPLAHSSSSR